MGRSRSSSFSRSRSRSRGRRSRSRSADEARLHVADLGMDCSKREIERVFEKFGKLNEVWLARNPPCFAFVVFVNKEDADEALRQLDGTMLCGGRVRVTYARPRTRGRGRNGWDPNMRCYQCGEKGHFSRDCVDTKYGYRRPPSRYIRGRYHGAPTRRRRSRSRSRGRRSRSRSGDRKYYRSSRRKSRDRRSNSKSSRSKSTEKRRSSRSREESSDKKRSKDDRSRSHSASKEKSQSPAKEQSPNGMDDEKSRSPSVDRSGSVENSPVNSEGSPARETSIGPDVIEDMVDVDTAERSPSPERSRSRSQS